MKKHSLTETPWPCQSGRKCLSPCPGCPGQEREARQDARVCASGVSGLTAGDLALLRGSATGEDVVPVTPTLLDDISASLKARFADIEERYPGLIAAAPVDRRLGATIICIRALFEHARDGGSFRYLIYERLGFGQDAYVPLCGDGMELSNDLEIDAETPDPLATASPGVKGAVAGAWKNFGQLGNDQRLALVAAVFRAIVEESDPVEAVILSGVDRDGASGKDIPSGPELRALLEPCGLAAIEKAWKARLQ
jgi:hypothetical protein